MKPCFFDSIYVNQRKDRPKFFPLFYRKLKSKCALKTYSTHCFIDNLSCFLAQSEIHLSLTILPFPMWANYPLELTFLNCINLSENYLTHQRIKNMQCREVNPYTYNNWSTAYGFGNNILRLIYSYQTKNRKHLPIMTLETFYRSLIWERREGSVFFPLISMTIIAECWTSWVYRDCESRHPTGRYKQRVEINGSFSE